MQGNFAHVMLNLADDSTIVTVTIVNGPLNVFSGEVARELLAVFQQLHANENIRAVIITGSGQRAFVAGADIKEFQRVGTSDAHQYLKVYQDALLSVENSPFPVIAAINGLALGGGTELALACDFRLAARSARFGLPEVGIGIIPAAGGTQRLPRLVPSGWARELLFTGELLSAEEAKAIGLVNHVVDDDDLINFALNISKKISLKSPVAVRKVKNAIQRGQDLPLSQALALETKLGAECFGTEDLSEGIEAFIQKRQPVFGGR